MIIALLFTFVSLCHGAATSYRGHAVLRCSPRTPAQLATLHALDEAGAYDFWKEPTRRGGFVDVMLTSSDRAAFELKMKTSGIPCRYVPLPRHLYAASIIHNCFYLTYHREMIEDVQDLIDEQTQEADKRRAGTDSHAYFDSYHPPDEVFAYIDALVSRSACKCLGTVSY